MPIYNDNRTMTVEQAKANSKIINAELPKATPAGIIDFFEIDIEDILFDNNLITKKVFNTNESDSERVFRFHNCLNFTTKSIKFQGKIYYAAPISITDIEYSTKGSLPRPKLTISANSKSIEAMVILRSKISELGDITKGKLIRRRTFTKFIDNDNPKNLLSQIPNHEENPKAILRLDVFFFFRKTLETETYLEFELATSLDTENVALPNRIVLQDKCTWQYRGEGCCYDVSLKKHIHGFESRTPPTAARSDSAVPVADGNNIPFLRGNNTVSILPSSTATLKSLGLWAKDTRYNAADYVYIIKNDIRYYFVCTLTHTNQPPPNNAYWTPDQCSKSVQGCKLRFDQVKGSPFGGFAAVRKTSA